MTKKSRLNPNKASRPTLKELEEKRILVREKAGLRYIIRADGAVDDAGYSTGYEYDGYNLPNFYPGAERTWGTVVKYQDQRAELTATVGRKLWAGHILDIGTHFPVNHLATQLLAQSRVDNGSKADDGPTVYGDAVLVTDMRMHWLFRPYNVTLEDLETFDAMLSTPRDLIKSNGRGHIFFHVEPCQKDLVAFKMRWI
jgi:hypothetical protein